MFKITSTSCRITTFVSNKKLGLTNFCYLSKKKLPNIAKVMDTQFNKFIYRATRDFHNDQIAEEFETKSIYESSTLEKNFDKLIGASKIKQVIESGYYVDKTKYFQKMIEGYLGYFIIRPKHFGKSLMLDTIAEICAGKKNKQLFKNTAIGQSPTYKWKKYPVFKFDFSKLNNESEEQFELALLNQMKENCKKYNIKHKESDGIMSLMHDMLKGGANLKNGYESAAVVLIDEYQAPLNNCQNKDKIIYIMRHFFCNLKSCNAMVLVTGSSRFGLADIFSPAHNLFDATLYKGISAICGFTKSELTEVFEDKITEMHRNLNMTKDELLMKLKYYYNGFKFSDSSEKKVYNPWSIIQCFSNNCIKPYWDGKCLEQYEELILNDVASISFAFQDPLFLACCIELNFDTEYKHITSKSILFQTGYLTIKDYDMETNMYTLKIPNYEVKTLLEKMIKKDIVLSKDEESQLLEAIIKYDFDQLIKSLRSHYNSWPYYRPMNETKVHIYFHGILRALCKRTSLMEFKYEPDIEIHTKKYIYIIKLKYFDGNENNKYRPLSTAREAIDQIYDKNYYVKHENSHKKIIFVGIVFGKHDIVDSDRMYLEHYKKLKEKEEEKLECQAKANREFAVPV